MHDIDTLSDDETNLLEAFRNGDRLVRARIMIAASKQTVDPETDDIGLLEYFAAYMDCNEYGRARCLEAAEIFASAPTIEEAHARLAEVEEIRQRCEVINIADARST